MSILITGGAGYIGAHTCVELLNAGYDIVVVDNFYNSQRESLKRVSEITGKSFPFYLCDIRDRAGLEKIFRTEKIDSVIHFAGLKAVGESVSIPLTYYDNNVNGTLVLCQVMSEFNCKKLVFSSSSTVYGEHNTAPFKETMPTGGTTNPYGTTKYMIELILQDLCKSDKDWSVCLLRYFNPIGAHFSGRIGENPNGIPNNLMPYITQVAVGRREKLSVYGNDYDTHDGTGVRDYIHVTDLAKGHLKAIEYCAQHTGAEIFNLGTGTGYSVLDVINAFVQASGINIPYEIVDRRPGDIATCYSDPTKAAAILGWKAEKTLLDMCRDSWNWQRNNPNGYEKPQE